MPTKKHIVIISSYLNVPGGYEKAVVTTANLFAEKGNEVTILILDDFAESFYPIQKTVRVIQQPLHFGIGKRGNVLTRKLDLLNDIRKLGRLLKELKPDLIICSEDPFAIAAILSGAKKFSKIVAWEHHHFYWQKKNRFWSYLFNKTYPKLDAVVCLNKEEKKHFEKFSPVTVIPNFIEMREAPAPGIASRKMLLSVCGLIHRKGIDILLAAAKQVLLKNKDWKWKLIGDGPLKNDVLRFIETEDLHERFMLQPPISPVITEEYRQASVFVLSSRFEAFPLVLLEALSFGLPCVSTDCPSGPSDIIEENVTGLLVEKENPEALATAITGLIGDESKIEAMSREAFRSARQFSPGNVYSLWEKLF